MASCLVVNIKFILMIEKYILNLIALPFIIEGPKDYRGSGFLVLRSTITANRVDERDYE